MSGYFGTDLQKELQKQAFENRHLIASTPGLYNGGRFIGVDDPDKLGWESVRDLLKRQKGVLGFRLITREQGRSVYPRVVGQGCRIDHWDVFAAGAGTIRPAIDAILRAGLPDGLRLCDPLSDPEGADTVRVQRFVADNGVAPLPGSMLVDGPEQATVMVADREGAVVAAAYAYFAHNAHSPHHRNAWVGMIAVDPSSRGAGLGRYVNALAIRRALEELGAERVHAFVASTNESSRRMVQACGLLPEPDLLCGVAVPTDAARFSR